MNTKSPLKSSLSGISTAGQKGKQSLIFSRAYNDKWTRLGLDEIRALLKQAQNKEDPKNDLALARLLTWAENVKPQDFFALPELQQSSKKVPRLGITGPPGAGKSTLVGECLKRWTQQGLKVAVLAVDPSSPFTRGAILGDRIRYQEHLIQGGVFIRSLGTRGSLGGLSASAYLMLRILDLCDFDLVLIETVGVGQTELEIVHVADLVSVILVPESGDSIQAMKAGLMEIANIFVVNKSDRPGADSLVNELAWVQGEDRHEVYKISALHGDGVDELAGHFFTKLKGHSKTNQRETPIKLQAEARALLRSEWESHIDAKVNQVKTHVDFLNTLKKS